MSEPVVHQLGAAFQRALAFAIEVHRRDVRKGDVPIPYVSHLLSVAALVLEDGGSETEAIAALLHDCAEDHGGEPMLDRIASQFSPEVAAIVRVCSDSLLPEGEAKEKWKLRKERYLAQLAEPSHALALRVSNADKLHNARAILADYRRIGDRLWQRFNADSAADQEWYYGELAAFFARARPDSPLSRELAATVDALHALIAASCSRESASAR